jgi:hypothetical protein
MLYIRQRGALLALVVCCWSGVANARGAWPIESHPTGTNALLANYTPVIKLTDTDTYCPYDAPNATCYITGISTTLNAAFAVALQGSLVISSSVLTAQPCETSFCLESGILITAGGNITLNGTQLIGPSIVLSAGDQLIVDANSTLISDSMGPIPQIPFNPQDGTDGTGGGHGGAGSILYTCRADAPVPKPVGGLGFGADNVSFPFDFGGGSLSFRNTASGAARGGGRVWLEASQSLTVNGYVSSNGQASPFDHYTGAGGGAGGSIYLGSANIDITSATMSATGGTSAYTGAGGGGIISLRGGFLTGLSLPGLDVSGGMTTQSCCVNCPVGGTGLIYRQQLLSLEELVGDGGSVAVPGSLYMRVHPEGRRGEGRVRRLSSSTFHSHAQAALGKCVSMMESSRRIYAPSNASTGPRSRSQLRVDEEIVLADSMTFPIVASHRAPMAPLWGEDSVSRPTNMLPPAKLSLQQAIAWDEAHCKEMLPEYFPGLTDTSLVGTLTCISTAQNSPLAPLTATTISYLDATTNVVLQSCAWDLSSLQSLPLHSWKISASNVQTANILLSLNTTMSISDLSRVDTTVMSLQLGGNMLLQQSLLYSGTLVVSTPGMITISQQAFMRFTFTLTVTAGAAAECYFAGGRSSHNN